MTAFQIRVWLAACWAVLLGSSFAIAQPPKGDEKKKKDEPPTKEELALRQGSKAFLYKFTPGEEFHSEARQKRVEHRNVQGKHRIETRELQLKLILTVDSVLPNGGAQISGRVAQVKFSLIGNEIKKYDSNNTKNNEDASEGWELYTDAKFKFNVDARGAVTNIRADKETADYWAQQPRGLRPLIADDVKKTLLPFIALPTDLVRRGTDWKEKRTVLDENFGKREVTINCSFHGTEQISGRTFQDIRLRAEAKQTDEKPKYEILEHHGEGKVTFDMERGNLREFRFDEVYLFNPPGAPLVEKEDDKEKKKNDPKKGGRMGSGQSSGQGMGGYPSGGDPRGGKGGGMKKKKEDKKKDKEDGDRPANKSVRYETENEVKITYRGKPISGD